jgi:hypothetical protein
MNNTNTTNTNTTNRSTLRDRKRDYLTIQGVNIPGREFIPTSQEPIDEDTHVKKYPEPTWKASFIVSVRQPCHLIEVAIELIIVVFVMQNTLKANPIVLAIPILLPISWALHFTHQSPVVVFVTSLLCIVPLAGGLSFA